MPNRKLFWATVLVLSCPEQLFGSCFPKLFAFWCKETHSTNCGCLALTSVLIVSPSAGLSLGAATTTDNAKVIRFNNAL